MLEPMICGDVTSYFQVPAVVREIRGAIEVLDARPGGVIFTLMPSKIPSPTASTMRLFPL